MSGNEKFSNFLKPYCIIYNDLEEKYSTKAVDYYRRALEST
jgi:hypothetical protein